eukprot:2044421-Pyramimonas_sp.AAC.2
MPLHFARPRERRAVTAAPDRPEGARPALPLVADRSSLEVLDVRGRQQVPKLRQNGSAASAARAFELGLQSSVYLHLGQDRPGRDAGAWWAHLRSGGAL